MGVLGVLVVAEELGYRRALVRELSRGFRAHEAWTVRQAVSVLNAYRSEIVAVVADLEIGLSLFGLVRARFPACARVLLSDTLVDFRSWLGDRGVADLMLARRFKDTLLCNAVQDCVLSVLDDDDRQGPIVAQPL